MGVFCGQGTLSSNILWAATRDAWYVEMICLRVWWNKSCRLEFLVIAFVTKAMRPMEKGITTAVPWFDPSPTRDPMDYTSQRRLIVTCFVMCTRPSWLRKWGDNTCEGFDGDAPQWASCHATLAAFGIKPFCRKNYLAQDAGGSLYWAWRGRCIDPLGATSGTPKLRPDRGHMFLAHVVGNMMNNECVWMLIMQHLPPWV